MPKIRFEHQFRVNSKSIKIVAPKKYAPSGFNRIIVGLVIVVFRRPDFIDLGIVLDVK